jgi:hypothetical protein
MYIICEILYSISYNTYYEKLVHIGNLMTSYVSIIELLFISNY